MSYHVVHMYLPPNSAVFQYIFLKLQNNRQEHGGIENCLHTNHGHISDVSGNPGLDKEGALTYHDEAAHHMQEAHEEPEATPPLMQRSGITLPPLCRYGGNLH